MALALFDLDNTLLNGDSDHGWGMYLAKIGAVDPVEQKQKQDFFYQQYLDGKLNIEEFCEYQFQILANTPLEQLIEWHNGFMESVIKPMIETGKASLLEKHREAGDEILIITATNDFVTEPIAKRLNVDTILATTAEFDGSRFTGKLAGIPCFQSGKIKRLQQWLENQGRELNEDTLADSYFYSDSINDLPLLQIVATPVAVTPDDRLRKHAVDHNWDIID
ncbi:MAG: HAD-IB family hydrolase [Gammaproteobacteria bacterium]|nr:HAD-IB family hydrolase [Gammaproteobacteria bacterium]